MYGKLGRVGIATPLGGEIIISDMYKYLHPDIQVAEMPLIMPRLSKEGLKQFSDNVVEAMAKFSDPRAIPVDLALFHCTSGSQVGGPNYDSEMSEAIKKASGARGALTTTTALLNALEAVGAHRLSVVTPYPEEINDMEKAYLENKGFEVVSICSIPTPDARNPIWFTKITEEELADFSIKHVDAKADALVISCCALHSIDVPNMIEKTTGIPTVTSNQCAVWAVGKFFGTHGPQADKLGMLFKK